VQPAPTSRDASRETSHDYSREVAIQLEIGFFSAPSPPSFRSKRPTSTFGPFCFPMPRQFFLEFDSQSISRATLLPLRSSPFFPPPGLTRSSSSANCTFLQQGPSMRLDQSMYIILKRVPRLPFSPPLRLPAVFFSFFFLPLSFAGLNRVT